MKSDELERLRIRYCGTDDMEAAVNRLARQTGWQVDQIWRWDWTELHDAIRVCMGERVTTDERKERALWLWNQGATWAEVSETIDNDRENWNALSKEIKRYAKKTGRQIREGEKGRIGKQE